MDTYYIYILASRHHRYVSVSVAAGLLHSVRNHRERVNRMLKRHRVFQKLVYVEAVRGVDEAIDRERQLRSYNLCKLGRLIESVNPGWENISLSALSRSGFSHIRQLL